MPPADADAAPPPPLAFPDTPERRLRRAMRQLEEALEQQREAVAAFRGQVGALRGAVAGLDARTRCFRTVLDDAAVQADRARSTAAELAATAALMEATARR
jgi:hypothetical protein